MRLQNLQILIIHSWDRYDNQHPKLPLRYRSKKIRLFLKYCEEKE